MTRRARLWWLALAGSLLLHAGLLGGLNWTLPQWEDGPEPPPIEARLVPPPVAALRPPPPKPKPPPPRPRPAPRPVPVVPEEPAEVPEIPQVEAEEPPVAVQDEPPEAEAAPASPIAEPAEAAIPPLNPLPSRLDLRFQVNYGFARGEQTLVWINEGERYTLTSVAAATGLTGVFYSGRFAQTSRGRITLRGLAPEEFWDQRGNKRSSARFDSASSTLTLTPATGAPRHFDYQGEVQDVLSLFFHLALTAPPPEGPLTYTVFNGKKLRTYTYDVRGEEILETELGALRTLHLVRRTDVDGRFEIWLAIDRHYLPVRILRAEKAGVDGELAILSIEVGE